MMNDAMNEAMNEALAEPGHCATLHMGSVSPRGLHISRISVALHPLRPYTRASVPCSNAHILTTSRTAKSF
jgi:hypothetical protein